MLTFRETVPAYYLNKYVYRFDSPAKCMTNSMFVLAFGSLCNILKKDNQFNSTRNENLISTNERTSRDEIGARDRSV